MIVTAWDGQKIAAPGFYSMPIEEYHGDCCDGPSVSSSGLRTIEARSPLHYWATSPLNPNRTEQPVKDCLDFGRAAHSLLLGEGEFRSRFALRPDGYHDYKTVAARQWRNSVRAQGRTPVTLDEIAVIRGMAASLEREPLVRAGLMTGAVEVSMFWKDEPTGIWLKSRPDAVPQAGEILADLKTAADVSPQAIKRSLGEFGYHMQAALAVMGMKALTGYAPPSFALIFVEKTPPYAVTIAQVDPEAIWYGARQIRRALDEMARCLETGEWPGPSRGQEITIGLPDWLRRRLERDAEEFRLPKIDSLLISNPA